ncbi:MAG: methylmalonyl Co-A mutase-associated GTPase MeaB [Candidatus Symbiobacter sp.]|nr:methylmalonyl Co-A mutase-associated GTPase MeaB [Candidatus Symbiobacter sp.]
MRHDHIPSLLAKIRGGERRALAQAITLIESERSDHRAAADRLIALTLAERSHEGNGCLRIGITGPPGAGKSSFIEAFGLYAVAHGHRLGVIAVDPSFWQSGGAIMGDKTRMELLSRSEQVFIRPSPARGALGGVTRHTNEMILLLEAAGFDWIIIETVGVGQSEMAVADLTDFLMILLPPAAGDDLQGIKGGILERADMILITKADGDLAAAALISFHDYQAALRLLSGHRTERGGRTERGERSKRTIPIMTVSAVTGKNLAACYQYLVDFDRDATLAGDKQRRRANQAVALFDTELAAAWQWAVTHQPKLNALYAKAQSELQSGQMTAAAAAARVIKGIFAG